MFLKQVARKACREVFPISVVLVLSEIVTICKRHALCMHCMVYVRVNLLIFSGLDSLSALQVISHLKSLAEGGRTVVCSIHQPSSKLFQMFDDVYIIKEGQCLYNGPINDLTSVLGEAGFQCPSFYNRADFGRYK
jgi:ABC-type Na+ transport system ATPase subunit NatA